MLWPVHMQMTRRRQFSGRWTMSIGTVRSSALIRSSIRVKPVARVRVDLDLLGFLNTALPSELDFLGYVRNADHMTLASLSRISSIIQRACSIVVGGISAGKGQAGLHSTDK